MLFRPRCLSVSSDGRILVFENILDGVTQNRNVHAWETMGWLPIPTSIRSPVELASLALDPTSRTVAGEGNDGRRIRLWDVTSGEDLLTLEGHAGGVGPIGFSPDDKTLAMCSIRSHGSSEIFSGTRPRTRLRQPRRGTIRARIPRIETLPRVATLVWPALPRWCEIA